MNPILWRLAIFATIALGGFVGGVAVTRSHYRSVLDHEHLIAANERLASQKAVIDATAANDSLVSTLEAKKNEANSVIDVITNRPVPRVPIPGCVSAPVNQTQPASGVAITIETSGILLRATQEILGADRQRTESIIAEAERELTVCRVSKDWVASQNKPD